jgi:hypothetical protein
MKRAASAKKEDWLKGVGKDAVEVLELPVSAAP